MDHVELKAVIEHLQLTKTQLVELAQEDELTVERWLKPGASNGPPQALCHLLRMMVKYKVSLADLESHDTALMQALTSKKFWPKWFFHKPSKAALRQIRKKSLKVIDGDK